MSTALVVGGGPNGLAAAISLAAEGVEVTVLYDALGSLSVKSAFFQALRAAGVDVGPLEVAARRLTRDVFPEPEVRFLGSSEWLARRAAGWAEAIRHIQRQVAAPVPDRQNKVEALLAHEIRCLVTGDLGA